MNDFFFLHVSFSNETVSQTTVTIGPIKMFRLEHETMNVCQTSVARFVHMVCRFDKISAFWTLGVNFRETGARKAGA